MSLCYVVEFHCAASTVYTVVLELCILYSTWTFNMICIILVAFNCWHVHVHVHVDYTCTCMDYIHVHVYVCILDNDFIIVLKY